MLISQRTQLIGMWRNIPTARQNRDGGSKHCQRNLALELPLVQMQEMSDKAGFTLSHSSNFDIIVEYFVEQGNYNVYEINEALFAFDQSLTEHKDKEMSLSMRRLHKRKSLLCHEPPACRRVKNVLNARFFVYLGSDKCYT